MLNASDVIDIVSMYGFYHEETRDDICIFSLNSGPFINALIIPLLKKSETATIKKEYAGAGYTCEVIEFKKIEEIDSYLFKQIFDLNLSKKKNLQRYAKFVQSKVELVDDSKYSYINPKYSINKKEGNKNVVSEIYNKLHSDKPILFLVEAAAGFGKTCSAFELLQLISSSEDNLIPLFSELSRNRQAKIFRYVLLDEIANSFHSINYALVITQIKEGRIPVILDGFDELLHENKADEGYEEAESMLDTIGEFLTDKAKVILTTRKSAIFDGDDFHEWVEQHENTFETIRIDIAEPSIAEWIPAQRLKALDSSKFKIKNISNPVLLSYLRSINDHTFDKSIKNPTEIVEQYFENMLTREQHRQQLKMSVKDQQQILKAIANDMLEHDYTSESRSYIIDLLEKKELPLLTKIQNKYTHTKISIDQLSSKLANHALLDRNTDGDKSIGFVNEFVLGHFCAEVLFELAKDRELIFETRFIQPAILAYENCSTTKKEKLWDALSWSLSEEKGHNKIAYSIKLFNEVRIDLVGDTVENLLISNITLGNNYQMSETCFLGCNFENVIFNKKNINALTFINCKFYNCSVSNESHKSTNINFINCTDTSNFESYFINTHLIAPIKSGYEVDSEITLSSCDLYILNKFWPIGGGFYKHRPIKGLITKSNQFDHNELLLSIDKLKKIDYLTIPTKRSFLELNQAHSVEIRRALDNVANK